MTTGTPAGGVSAESGPGLAAFQAEVARLFFGLPESRGFLLAGGAALLAQHLTANLLVNRGLVPADTARPTRLPESWDFPSARGYARARHIGERVETQAAHSRGVRTLELSDALRMFEDFYMEMLELETEDPAAEL